MELKKKKTFVETPEYLPGSRRRVHVTTQVNTTEGKNVETYEVNVQT